MKEEEVTGWNCVIYKTCIKYKLSVSHWCINVHQRNKNQLKKNKYQTHKSRGVIIFDGLGISEGLQDGIGLQELLLQLPLVATATHRKHHPSARGRWWVYQNMVNSTDKVKVLMILSTPHHVMIILTNKSGCLNIDSFLGRLYYVTQTHDLQVLHDPGQLLKWGEADVETDKTKEEKGNVGQRYPKYMNSTKPLWNPEIFLFNVSAR